MLKFVGIIGSVLASVVIVPAAALDGGRRGSPVESLEAAIGQTVQALELLAGMQTRADEGHVILAIAARQISETPLPGDQERDEKLQLLRTQVGLLQQELDILEYRIANVRTGSSFREEEAPKKDGIPITRGLDASALSELKLLERPAPDPEELPPPVEHLGYSADTLLQGQACYRAGQYERGITLLKDQKSLAGQYWYGRCLERAGYLEQAAKVYRTVSELEDGGSFTERAKTNLEFVQWKSAFVKKLPSGEEQ